jgi:hypothetical protein
VPVEKFGSENGLHGSNISAKTGAIKKLRMANLLWTTRRKGFLGQKVGYVWWWLGITAGRENAENDFAKNLK